MSDSDDSDIFLCEGPKIDDQETRDEATYISLPEKSKKRYQAVYNIYMRWCNDKYVENIGSEQILFTYFMELAKRRKPTTLWATYSMLKTTISINDSVDISKHKKLLAFLKRANADYKPKKSNVFSKAQVEQFLNEAPLKLLPIKVVLIVAISGDCRIEDLIKMKISDVDFMENRVSFIIPTRKFKSRFFVVTQSNWIDLLKQYQNLRKHAENDRFFLQIRFGKVVNQPLGHNTISRYPRKIAEFLKLKNAENYTGNCFRRTAVDWLQTYPRGQALRFIARDETKQSTSVTIEQDEPFLPQSEENIPAISPSPPSLTTMIRSEQLNSVIKEQPLHGIAKILPSSTAPLTSTSSQQTEPSTRTVELNFSAAQIRQGLILSINSNEHGNLSISIKNK